MRILVLEDDRLIGDGIKTGLGQLGFSVDWFKDGAEGMAALVAADYDAAILDLGLPNVDGMDVLACWRRQGRDVPVLILTARGTLDDRIRGLDAGADDYLAKPFALTEVAARLRALIRRRHGHSESKLQHGAVTLDVAARSLTLDGKPVELTARELALAELFLNAGTRVLSREQIEEKLYAWGEAVGSNTIEVYVHHLRRKLGRDFITTVRGFGYRLGDPA